MQNRNVVSIQFQIFQILHARNIDLFQPNAMHERLQFFHQFIAQRTRIFGVERQRWLLAFRFGPAIGM